MKPVNYRTNDQRFTVEYRSLDQAHDREVRRAWGLKHTNTNRLAQNRVYRHSAHEIWPLG